jgi:hypothetical protein
VMLDLRNHGVGSVVTIENLSALLACPTVVPTGDRVAERSGQFTASIAGLTRVLAADPRPCPCLWRDGPSGEMQAWCKSGVCQVLRTREEAATLPPGHASASECTLSHSRVNSGLVLR